MRLVLDASAAVRLVMRGESADKLAEPRQLALTANRDTVYMSGVLDLREGPMVMELPPGLLGTMNNIWQQPLVDLGLVLLRVQRDDLVAPAHRVAFLDMQFDHLADHFRAQLHLLAKGQRARGQDRALSRGLGLFQGHCRVPPGGNRRDLGRAVCPKCRGGPLPDMRDFSL